MSSLYETLFYILFSHFKEPLLLCGPTGYKSKLAKSISTDACEINLFPEISNSELIGAVSLVTNYQAKDYYLEQICKISKNEGKLKELEKDLEKYYEEKKKEVLQKMKKWKKKQLRNLKKKKILKKKKKIRKLNQMKKNLKMKKKIKKKEEEKERQIK